jgi:hypothetical protein
VRAPSAPAALLAALLAVAAAARAGEGADAGVDLPEPEEVESRFPEGERLSGREIYERFIDRRSRESLQKLRIVSRDPGGSEQLSRFELYVQDARDDQGRPTDGVRARTRIDVSDPFDLRHTKYLIVSKDPGPDDEFVYQPSARRVRRVDLKSTNFLGTDYAFNDIAVQNIEDAQYVRLPDEEIDGRPVYVVETHVKETIDVEHHRTIVYLDKQHYVPLRVRYWDDFGVEVKELTAPADKIRAFDDTFVAAESTMRDLRQGTSSTLYVDDLDASPEFGRGVFSVNRLTRGK